MSVEGIVISKLVEEGSPKKAFQAGVTQDDFEIHDDEWMWIVGRAERKLPINPRVFKKVFPEFDFIEGREKLTDLLDELKDERAYVSISSALDEVWNGEDPLSQENAVQKAMTLRETLGEVLKIHAPYSDVAMKSGWRRAYERIQGLRILRDNGEPPGIQTGITHFDFHFGGLKRETSYLILGRPGDAKSFTLTKFAVEAAWEGYNVGFFSPEMTEHQHNCRVHTLLSAKEDVQKALGLRGAFRNRALYHGRDFNEKEYRRFLQWIEDNVSGEIYLFTQKYRREKMSLSYIETRIEDYGLDVVIVDPLYKLRSPTRRGTRWEELGEITDSLIDLSHSYNIPVVMSNQASRALVGRNGEAPSLDSSFGADAPAQEANCVIGVKHFSDENLMRYNCSKNRDGEPFRFSAKFFPNVGVLQDVTPLRGDLNGYNRDVAKELQEAMRSAFGQEQEPQRARKKNAGQEGS